MAPGSRCMRATHVVAGCHGHTAGLSWCHESKLGGDRVLLAMAPHTITPAVGAVRRCEAKAGLRRSPRGIHTRIRLSRLPRLNLDSSLKTTWFHFAAVQFPRAWQHSKRRRQWVGVKGSALNEHRDSNVL
ncbi:uncharacterized protein TNCV_4937941 [Trichonephila clavipes]|nr:uncharacterized protein TNCV_4937941 [Trichonephila clavipes]